MLETDALKEKLEMEIHHDRRRDFLPAIRILSSFRPCSQSEMNWKIFRCVIFSGICYFRWKMYWNRHGYSVIPPSQIAA